jgi:type II secretory pathway component HofQ
MSEAKSRVEMTIEEIQFLAYGRITSLGKKALLKAYEEDLAEFSYESARAADTVVKKMAEELANKEVQIQGQAREIRRLTQVSEAKR